MNKDLPIKASSYLTLREDWHTPEKIQYFRDKLSELDWQLQEAWHLQRDILSAANRCRAHMLVSQVFSELSSLEMEHANPSKASKGTTLSLCCDAVLGVLESFWKKETKIRANKKISEEERKEQITQRCRPAAEDWGFAYFGSSENSKKIFYPSLQDLTVRAQAKNMDSNFISWMEKNAARAAAPLGGDNE